MPIYSTNKIASYGTSGGRVVTDNLQIDLNRSNSTCELVDVTLSLIYTGVTYGGQDVVNGNITFTSSKAGTIAAPEFTTGPNQTVSVTKTVQLSKDLGNISVGNILSVFPYCSMDFEEGVSEALFVVAFPQKRCSYPCLRA